MTKVSKGCDPIKTKEEIQEQMRKTLNKSRTDRANHTVYGGEITIDDFDTYRPNKRRISNQAAANNLPLELQKKAERERNMKKYKEMTPEELRREKLISNSDGRPSDSLTDEKWQKEFEIRKLLISPSPDDVNKLGKQYSRESGMWNEETNGTYEGMTNWQSYCNYINDILKNIRAGQIDYCYFIYQIEDLLKFCHEDLKTKYKDGFWEVWLEKKD